MVGVLVWLLGCASPEAVIDCETLSQHDLGAVERNGGNVLVIVSDDIGQDKTGAYNAHPAPAPTPNIDQLACAGVVFHNAYSNPLCSPSRSALLTGRHGSRTGIGRWIYADTATEHDDLKLAEITIPEMLARSPHGYTSAAVGKWHLVGFDRHTDPALHPNDQGFSYYAGSLGNPREALQEGNTPRSYENWEKVTNGTPEWMTTYMSTDTADEAIAQLQTLPEPWFLYVAFNGAHEPLHVPPRRLLSEPPPNDASDITLFNAMVEATDAEIGRVIASIPPEVLARTTIVYLTDNGTPRFGIDAPWDNTQGKGTLYESGVNVPMIVTGPFVTDPGRTSAALVHFVDLFPTVAEIAAVSSEPEAIIDGVSFLPQLRDPDAAQARSTVFAEMFYPNGPPPYEFHHRMVTDAQWKLIRNNTGGVSTEELYQLTGWTEEADLIETIDSDNEAAAAYDRLRAALDTHIADLPYAH